jgi:hypothetical protein
VQIPHVLADPEYTLHSRGSYRTILGVPLLREGDQVGIENARLFEAEQASKLIGEGLEQIDLSVGERAYLVISHRAL